MAPYATLTWHGEIYVCNENIKQYTVKFLKRSNETAFWTYKKAAKLRICIYLTFNHVGNYKAIILYRHIMGGELK